MPRLTSSTDSNWHLDFRNVETLPDIKVVRTDFFVNILFSIIALCLMGGFAFQEYNAYLIRSELDEMKAKRASGSSNDGRSLKSNKEFINARNKLNELFNFLESPISPAEFVLSVAEIRPDKLFLRSIEMMQQAEGSGRGKEKIFKQVVINGTLEEVDLDIAQGIIEKFKTDIGEIESIKENAENVALKDWKPDKEQGLFTYSIVIRMQSKEVKKGRRR